jgi:hypothetical protein
MTTIHNKAPDPIVNENYLRNGDGSHLTVGSPFRGDHFDLSTGECNVARVIAGIRYDTAQATLIASKGTIDEDACNYRLNRLYRASHGAFFLLTMEWSHEEGFVGPDFIRRVADEMVLTFARDIVPPADCVRFFRDWYCTGWIPRNDSEAQGWAEFCLSADDCEAVMLEIASSTRRG